MLRVRLRVVGCIIGLLFLSFACLVGWRYYQRFHDPELAKIEHASAAARNGLSGEFGTYDSFLKELLAAKRLFYVLPPFVCSGLDKLSEHFEYGDFWLYTDWRDESFSTICDIHQKGVGDVDDDDEGGFRYINTDDDPFNCFSGTRGIAAIIWVPLKDGAVSLYFVAAGRQIIRKETLSFSHLF